MGKPKKAKKGDAAKPPRVSAATPQVTPGASGTVPVQAGSPRTAVAASTAASAAAPVPATSPAGPSGPASVPSTAPVPPVPPTAGAKSPASSAPRLSEARLAKVKFSLSRYPRGQAAMLPVLRLAQEEFGHISPEVEEYVAGLINVPPIEVHEAASFYTLFYKKPVGRHIVSLCTNISCFLRGSDALLTHCVNKLGIKPGQTTADGRVTLFSVECLANCDQAPCAQIDDDKYTGPLDAAALDKILDGLS